MDVFPLYYRGLSVSTYWVMGIIGALGLFGSIILHELRHSRSVPSWSWTTAVCSVWSP